MKRIVISDDLRRKAHNSNAYEIFLANPRDIIKVVDKVNELVDAYNRDHPPEVSNSILRELLFHDELQG